MHLAFLDPLLALLFESSRSRLQQRLRTATMSFRFDTSDFLDVDVRCWKLYQNVDKVSRDAPDELRRIRDELGALSNTIRLLNDDIRNPHSMIKQPGQEERSNLAADIMKSTSNTLEQLQSLAEKHKLLRTQGTDPIKWQYLRAKWDKLKLARDWNAFTDLRAKVLLPSRVCRNLLAHSSCDCT